MPSRLYFLTALTVALSTLSPSLAHPDGHHSSPGQLAARWWHQGDAEVLKLFKRQGGSTAPIGSPEWVAQYPPVQGVPSPALADIPERWLAAYNASKAAGLIPDIPLTTIPPTGGNPVYPNGLVGTDPNICTATLKCRIAGDIWDAPDGMIGISFDDGPVAVAPELYQFLRTNNVPSTHFMIGRVILGDLDWFDIAFQQNHASIAVHTWSHPMMTTQTDYQVLVELGWTMQLIHDITNGRVPIFWRPPLGDMDLRVHAIAQHVFNLTTVIWNQDTEDWRLSTGLPGQYVSANLTIWLNGAKSPGLIILEHELTNDTIGFFMNTTYPLAVKNGWKMANIPDLFNLAWYANAQNDLDASPTSELIGVSAASISSSAAASGGSSGSSGGSGTTGGSSGGSSGGSKGNAAGARAHVGAGAFLGTLAAAMLVLA